MSYKPAPESLSFLKSSKKRGDNARSSSTSPGADVRWSTPERRDGTRCLSLIPNEIYMMIFEELQPLLYGYTINEHKRTIASLCLVCSFFRAICQPRMFHHLTFKGNASTTIAKRQANWRASLAVRDARCVALSSHIKSCAYQEWMADLDQEWIYTGLLQKNLQSASFLQSLKSVTLRQCTVTPSVLLALTNIPRLLEVEMLLCETTPVSLDGLAGIPRRGWTSISITRCYYMTHYLTPALMKLIAHGQLRTLVAPDRTAADLVEAIILADAPSTSRLENLDVFFPRTSTAAFLNYLTRARDLRKLVVRSPNTTIANSNNITLRCKVKLSDAMGGRLLFCTINLFALYDFDVAVYRAVLGAWNPSPTLQNLSFNMTIDYDRAENSAESNLPRAVILPIFELLWRMKTSSNPTEEQIFLSAATLSIDFQYNDRTTLGPSKWLAGWKRLAGSMCQSDLHGLLDTTFNDTFPNLTSIENCSVIKWQRRPEERVWHSTDL